LTLHGQTTIPRDGWLPLATDPDQSLPIPDDSRDERRDRREPRGEGRR
jgi:hypothetical protein